MQGVAQSMSKMDSLRFKQELKRKADNTRVSLRKIAIKKRQDSMAVVIKLRQAERLRKADSTREVKRKIREADRKRNKEFVLRKKQRERIRDSIAIASKKAAAARKAYLKKKKKLKNKLVSKKKDASQGKEKTKNTNKLPKKKVATHQKKPKKEKIKKPRKKRRKDISIVTKNEKKKKEKKTPLAKPKKKAARVKKEKKKTVKNPTKKIVKKSKQVDQKKKLKVKKKEQALPKKKKTKIVKKETSPDKLPIKQELQSSIYPDYYANPVVRKRIKRMLPPEKKKSFFAFQFGQSGYLGDLGGGSSNENNPLRHIDFKENKFFYGFSYSHIRKEAVGVRLSYVFGQIAGSDKNTFFEDVNDPAYSRFVRNLDFKSTISEGSIMAEIYPFKFFSYEKKLHNSYFQPYGLIGIGRYSFNPQGSIFDPILEEDVWIDLQPLSLEGQGFTEYPNREVYKLSQWNMPFGIGLKYEISQTVSAGFEYVGRILNTDYLDDLSTLYIEPDLFDKYLTPENATLAKMLNNKSKLIDANRAFRPGQQRGNINNNDFYFSLSARVIVKLSKNKKKKQALFKYDDNEICE
jgi:hypothetical protein